MPVKLQIQASGKTDTQVTSKALAYQPCSFCIHAALALQITRCLLRKLNPDKGDARQVCIRRFCKTTQNSVVTILLYIDLYQTNSVDSLLMYHR